MKILAVDDDAFILELLAIVVKRVGFADISTAPSGEGALKMLRNEDVTYDCLLFDISMPEMDGIELCALTRAIPRYEKTPMIMVTAMTEKTFIDRASAAGATDYVTKPFDIVELSTRLRIAEELVAARRSGARAVLLKDGSYAEQTDTHSYDLSDEVKIDGVKWLTDYHALQSYVSQLSLAGVASSQVLAFKIDQIKSIHARASRDEFLYALTEAASAIGEALRNDTPTMAYAGRGLFLTVSGKPSLEHSKDLEAEIQFILDERDIQFDNGDPLDIDISVSNPIRPNISKLQRVRKTVERAIARAENRSLRKRSEKRALNIRLIGRQGCLHDRKRPKTNDNE